MNKIEIGGYKRITKAAACKLYNDGKDVYMCPAKLSPVNLWQGAMLVNREIVKHEMYNSTFENVYNHFWYYNCNNERGNYIAFYVKEKNNEK